jgi:hypothetical protein
LGVGTCAIAPLDAVEHSHSVASLAGSFDYWYWDPHCHNMDLQIQSNFRLSGRAVNKLPVVALQRAAHLWR